jgi:CRISPR/Cas system CSM-associated protein Csm2 small subunit
VPDQAAFELDMRNLLRSKKSNGANESEERSVALASLISQMSFRSIKEIDHLIEGLQGVRKKLDGDGDRIQREIGNYVTFSQSIVDLTRIVSEGMAAVNHAVVAVARDVN